MTEYSKGRKIRAMIGVTLILATASGGTGVMNAIIPFLLTGMQVDLSTFMIGPTVATILAFIMSSLGVRVINIITPKWCMLIGSLCGAFTMFIVGRYTTFPMWMLANCLNGAVLAFATYAAAGGVVAEFYGDDTQKAFGVVAGITGFIVSGWQALTALFLGMGIPYGTLFIGYAVAIIAIGLVANLMLIGPIARKQIQPVVDSDASKKNADTSALPGFTFRETLSKGPSIFFFLVAMAVVAWCGSGITSYATTFFTSFQMAGATAAALFSVFGFAASTLKLFSGFFIRKFGPKVMASMIYLGFAIGVVFLLVWSKTGILALAIIGMILCAFIEFAAMVPGLFIPDLYGMKDYAGISSAGMAGYYLGAVTVLYGLSLVVAKIGFFNAFVVLIVAAIVTFAFMFLAVGTAPLKKKKAE